MNEAVDSGQKPVVNGKERHTREGAQDGPGMNKVKTVDLALGLIRLERDRQQTDKGYTPGHDDQHTPQDWIAFIAHELGCAAELAFSESRGVITAYVKIAAVAVAAVEAELRRAAGVVEEPAA